MKVGIKIDIDIMEEILDEPEIISVKLWKITEKS